MRVSSDDCGSRCSLSSDIPIDHPLDVQSGDPPTTPVYVPQASTTTTQQEPPSSITVPSPSVPQPTSHRHRMYLPDYNRSGASVPQPTSHRHCMYLPDYNRYLCLSKRESE
ncbi:hypothetical protein ADUPG1_013969 [Aduncisulcus paluster]|uniref:Uncharacterized protein n=1 Tax=Aduncisulcus paluster TaxID=2918883 RepID=A0ABQ5K528_9EUKA|nr:hypothetical protein ADUPG1_013969 [Aduncisulcus paluster]